MVTAAGKMPTDVKRRKHIVDPFLILSCNILSSVERLYVTQARKNIPLHSSTFPRQPAPTPRGREAPQGSFRVPRCLARRSFPAQRRRTCFRPPPHKLRRQERSCSAVPPSPHAQGSASPCRSPCTSLTRSDSGCSGLRRSHLSGLAMSARLLLLLAPAGPEARRWRREGAQPPSRRGSEPPAGAGRRGNAPALAAAHHGRRSRARLRGRWGGNERDPRTRPPLCHRGARGAAAVSLLPIGPRGAFPPYRASPGFSRPPALAPPHRAPAGMRQSSSFSPLPSACQTGAGNCLLVFVFVLAFATAGAH